MTNKYTAFRFVSDTHKECSKCNEIKLHSEFHKDGGRNNIRHRGLSYYCKVCACASGKVHHKRRMKEDDKYKLSYKNRYIKRQYGISLQEYEARLAKQEYLCAICRNDMRTVGYPSLDHCHKTGKLRAFLCMHCNHGLGAFMDNPEVMEKAAEYIRTHNSEMIDSEKEDKIL